MAELFQITKAEKARPIGELPFRDELEELEPLIKDNSQVLGESIEVFAEQVDTGTGDRIDLLALDRTAGTAQIVLIELKRDIAKQETLLQTLRYANWVKNSPDSIKLLLAKKKITVENVEFDPKIIIVAPLIDPSLIELSQHINAFEFDFVEVRRFGTKENCYLVTDHKTLLRPPISKVRATEEWDWEKYKAELNIRDERIEIGKNLFNKLATLCQEKQWQLDPIFRKYYISFKFGGRKVVYIDYSLDNQFCHLGFKLKEVPDKLGLKDPHPELKSRYWEDVGEYLVRVETADFDITPYIPFIEEAYRRVTKA